MAVKNKLSRNIRFMDFCAGIGAGRLGLERNGLICRGFSEIDSLAEKTYRKLFDTQETNYGDLMKIDPRKLPDFEMMIAGFPCQTFSVVGKRKGMKDERGQVIYGLIKIMLAKNLRYFILENVKGLTNHDGGNSLSVILQELDKAGYYVSYKVLNSINYGVPQMRERIYFVGVRKDLIPKDFSFEFPEGGITQNVSDYLVDEKKLEFDENDKRFVTFKKYLKNKYNRGLFELEDILKRNWLVVDTRQSDIRLYENRVPTLRTGRHGILYIRNGKLRKLSGYESLLLQGFPKKLAKKVDGFIEEAHLLRQTGNAMTVNVIQMVAERLFDLLEKYEKNK